MVEVFFSALARFALMKKKMSLKVILVKLQPTSVPRTKITNFHKCRRWIFQWFGRKTKEKKTKANNMLADCSRSSWGDSMTPTLLFLTFSKKSFQPRRLKKMLSSEKSFKEINDFHRPTGKEEEKTSEKNEFVNEWKYLSEGVGWGTTRICFIFFFSAQKESFAIRRRQKSETRHKFMSRQENKKIVYRLMIKIFPRNK